MNTYGDTMNNNPSTRSFKDFPNVFLLETIIRKLEYK